MQVGIFSNMLERTTGAMVPVQFIHVDWCTVGFPGCAMKLQQRHIFYRMGSEPTSSGSFLKSMERTWAG